MLSKALCMSPEITQKPSNLLQESLRAILRVAWKSQEHLALILIKSNRQRLAHSIGTPSSVSGSSLGIILRAKNAQTNARDMMAMQATCLMTKV